MRQQALRFLAQALGFLELGLDAVAAMVERIRHLPMHSDIGKDADENEKSDRNKEFSVELEFEHRPYPQRLSASPTAAVTASAGGSVPIRRLTIAPATSIAMPRTLPIAASFVPAMVFSAPASLASSWPSSSLRLASAFACCSSRVALARAWARLRASAKAFSSAWLASSASALNRCASERSPSILLA